EQAPVTEAAPAEPVKAEPPVSRPVVVAGHRHATAEQAPVTEAAPAEPVKAEPPVSRPVVVAGHRHAT
ncbi:hypothetical protein C0U44_32780, partial [Klebsiella pneumoniae]